MASNDEQLYDDEAAWEDSSEGRDWRRKHERERRDEDRQRAEQERRWLLECPVEYAAWQAVQLVWTRDIDLTSFDREYGFLQFLAEVKPAPSPHHRIERKYPTRGFSPGNLAWGLDPATTDRADPKPEYLSLKQVAAMTRLSYDYVYDAVQKGDLAAVLKARQWRVKPADAHAWMDRGRRTASPVPRGELADKVNRYFPARNR